MLWTVIALAILSGCGGRGSIERQAADQLTVCMKGNGGVDASNVRFSIDGKLIGEVELSYLGQGSDPYDAVYNACLSQVADELGLVLD